jgi:hypothetical protein
MFLRLLRTGERPADNAHTCNTDTDACACVHADTNSNTDIDTETYAGTRIRA